MSNARYCYRNEATFMNIELTTEVPGNFVDVMAHFDRDLFEALKPKHADMEIVEFTGSKTGDKVHIRFHQPFKMEWISAITDHGKDENEAYFIDEGIQLPPGLSYWKHKHIVRKINPTTSEIIDNITFKGPNILVSLLLYPAIYLGFLPRKKIYKKYFGART